MKLDLANLSNRISVPLIPAFAPAYQSYPVSHARSGDPNTCKKTINVLPAITWPKPGNTGNAMTGVLDATDLGFTLITDQETKKSVYNFWIRVASALTDLDAARECDADNAGAGNE